MVCYYACHCWGSRVWVSQCLVWSSKVVVHEVKSQSVDVIFHFLREGIG